MPGGNDVGDEAAMLNYVARRLVLALITCAAISVLTFVIIRVPAR
jgi:ABC-type dipeptide/oligopeptide/nickel transport system permease component